MNIPEQERRKVERIPVDHDIFIMVENELCEVIDISFKGASFSFKEKHLNKVQCHTTLEIYFMNGPLLYVEDIPYSLVNHQPIEDPLAYPAKDTLRRASVQFNVDKFRQVIDFHYLMTLYNAKNQIKPTPSHTYQYQALHGHS